MNIYVIGAGTMGNAMIKQLARARWRIFVYTRTVKKIRNAFSAKHVMIVNDIRQIHDAQVVLVCVKPQDLSAVGKMIAHKLHPSAILVSIAAGVKIKQLKKIFKHKKVVRLMPNIGILVGKGIAAWIASGLTKRERYALYRFLHAISENIEVHRESEIDTVTAISGSGPAYVLYLTQTIQESAEKLGLSKVVARQLTEKTLSAAAELQSGAAYQDVINRIVSKKGTTEAALNVFKRQGLKRIIFNAIKAARHRSEELSALSDSTVKRI